MTTLEELEQKRLSVKKRVEEGLLLVSTGRLMWRCYTAAIREFKRRQSWKNGAQQECET